MSSDQEEQYGTDANLAARQRLWATSRREPPFDLMGWVLDLAGLEPESDLDVLDLGCGNGLYEGALVRRGHRGRRVALDLSAGMLSRITNASAIQADVQAIPFRPATFDAVLAPHMLYHVPDVETAAAEARRVTRPDGVFVAVTNGLSNMAELGAMLEAAVGTDWRIIRPADRHFSLETGASKLSGSFERVERVDCPTSAVVITDLDVLAGYWRSLATHYEPEVGQPWNEVVERALQLARKASDGRGELRVTTSIGAFLCR